MSGPVYLSVILSTYNDEKYIEQSIQSILDQTYPYFEFIIVNDGGTDRTIDIVRSFNDDRIRIIDKTNSGLIDSLNTGIKAARYDWIARMDGDDIALPERFEKQVKFIEEHDNSRIGVVGGQAELIDTTGQSIGSLIEPESAAKINLYLKLGISPIIHPSAIINKKAIVEMGMYDKFIYCSEDVDMWMRLHKEYEIHNIDDIVLKYRINPAGITQSKRLYLKQSNFISLVKSILDIRRPYNNFEYSKIKQIMDNDSRINTFLNDEKESHDSALLKTIYKYYFLLYRYHLANVVAKTFLNNKM